MITSLSALNFSTDRILRAFKVYEVGPLFVSVSTYPMIYGLCKQHNFGKDYDLNALVEIISRYVPDARGYVLYRWRYKYTN